MDDSPSSYLGFAILPWIGIIWNLQVECSNAQVLAWINWDDIVLNELGDLMKMIQDQELRQTFNNIILNYKIHVN